MSAWSLSSSRLLVIWTLSPSIVLSHSRKPRPAVQHGVVVQPDVFGELIQVLKLHAGETRRPHAVAGHQAHRGHRPHKHALTAVLKRLLRMRTRLTVLRVPAHGDPELYILEKAILDHDRGILLAQGSLVNFHTRGLGVPRFRPEFVQQKAGAWTVTQISGTFSPVARKRENRAP